jgi:acyl-CoA thioesterase-2
MTEPAAAAAPDIAVARLLALLDLETIEVDLFRGQSTDPGWTRVYGGQVVAQALVAASRTVRADRLAHSLHAYFLRPGDPAAPIIYRVERERDGTSFATRRVAGIQHGKAIFSLTASFQVAEGGFEHAAAMPRVTAPALLRNDAELFAANAAAIPEPWRTLWTTRDRPIEIRPVEPHDLLKPKKAKPVAHNWLRVTSPVTADPVLARALLAYASDMTLLDTCLLPHAVTWRDPALQAASIDHAIWFHTTPDLNLWHLFAQDSPRAAGARGFNRGQIFAADGTLVASVAQEGLMRYRA